MFAPESNRNPDTALTIPGPSAHEISSRSAVVVCALSVQEYAERTTAVRSWRVELTHRPDDTQLTTLT